MLQQLGSIENRFEEVKQQVVDPEVLSDPKKYAKLAKEYKDLEDVVKVIHAYRDILGNIETNKAMLKEEDDAELKEMAKMELDELEEQQPKIEEELKMLLIPKDPNDSKNVVLEIRAGTGGNEASLFVGDLLKMYEKYASAMKWKTSLTDFTDGTAGGFNKIVMMIEGTDAFGVMKFESGVHRVQRIPATESQGRIHTSAVTVAAMPEAEEFDIEIVDADLKVDYFCASGPGGQSVNTTYSAVRLTHIPSGLVVSNQDQKSQLKNKAKAMKVLRSRLYDRKLAEVKARESAMRKSLVSTGDRSAKIRTYNYPQGRVTDHRINLTLYSLQNILGGDLTEISEKLRIAENTEKLKNG